MKRIAIPVFGERISNRIDCSERLMLFSIEAGKIRKSETVYLPNSDPLAKLNMLIELKVEVLICNGITEFYLHKLSKNNVKIIPWINGEVMDVLARYLNGNLAFKVS